MRTVITLTIAVALLATVVPVVLAQSVADEAAIRKANEQRFAAFNAKDVKAYLAFFDEGCTSSWTGGPCLTEMKASGKFPETQKNAKIRVVKEIGVVFVTPDVAIFRYTSEGSGFVDADGKPQPPGESDWARIYVKKSGKWLDATSFMQVMEE